MAKFHISHTATLTYHTRSVTNILDVNPPVPLPVPPVYLICKTSKYVTDITKGKCLRITITNQFRGPLLSTATTRELQDYEWRRYVYRTISHTDCNKGRYIHWNICNMHMDSLGNCPHISFYRPVVLRIKVSSFQGSGPIEVFVCIW